MWYRLYLFLSLNVLDFKRYLKLNVGFQANIILQLVMVYNVIVWGFFFAQTRRNLHLHFTGSPNRRLDFSQELKAVFGNTNRYDQKYLALRHYYRLYLGFLIILILATLLFFYPATWQLAIGSYLFRFLASTHLPLLPET